MERMIIGIFDSGKGAWFVKAKLEQLLPKHTYVVETDTTHVPYGSRSEDEIRQLVDTALQPLLAQTRLIVIACNTATAVAIVWLRERYPNHTFVGYEPMLKVGGEKAQHCCVLATTVTRASKRYQDLKTKWCQTCQVDEPDTTDWASLIEQGREDEIDFTDVSTSVSAGATIVILACTHYLTLQGRLQKLFPHVEVIEPTSAVAQRIKTLLVD